MTDKLLVMTDLHLRGPGKTIIGLDPRARLQQVLDHALHHHGDAQALILMGDLTHSGLAEEYAILSEVMAPCPIPVTYMLGNHDDRDRFHATFPDRPTTAGGFVQSVTDLPHHRIITLDSFDAAADPEHSGTLCPTRMTWLRAALAGAGGRMPLVFIHHPPHQVGIPGMDPIRLTNGPELLELLHGSGAHLFCGHVHRTISGQAAGVPFTMFKGTCHQGVLNFTDTDCSLSVAEPGAYGVLLLPADGVIAHSEDVGLNTPPVASDDALPEITA